MLERLHEMTTTSERLVEFRHSLRSESLDEAFDDEIINGFDLTAFDVLSTCDCNAHVSSFFVIL